MKPSYILGLALLIFISITIIGAGCKKSKNSGPDYTSKMGGIRNWHGVYNETLVTFTDSGYIQRDTSWDLNDISFALLIIDKDTVEIFGYKLFYQSTDSASSISYFGDENYAYHLGPVLMYYYNTNSMQYSYTVQISAIAGTDNTTYYTY